MSENDRKRGHDLEFWMVLLGVLAAYTGAGGLRNWADFAQGTQAFLAFSLAGGITLTLCGLFLWTERPWRRAALWVGLFGGAVLFVNHALGLWMNTILCYTPT